MLRNVQEASKGIWKISQSISSVSTVAGGTTQGSNQTKDAADEL
jgi:hypothetical protein